MSFNVWLALLAFVAAVAIFGVEPSVAQPMPTSKPVPAAKVKTLEECIDSAWIGTKRQYSHPAMAAWWAVDECAPPERKSDTDYYDLHIRLLLTRVQIRGW